MRGGRENPVLTAIPRKHEFWLAETVGLVTAAIGLSLCRASRSKTPSPEARLLSLAAAAGFAVIDLRYGLTRRIQPVYLLDGLAQLAFIRTGAGFRSG